MRLTDLERKHAGLAADSEADGTMKRTLVTCEGDWPWSIWCGWFGHSWSEMVWASFFKTRICTWCDRQESVEL